MFQFEKIAIKKCIVQSSVFLCLRNLEMYVMSVIFMEPNLELNKSVVFIKV